MSPEERTAAALAAVDEVLANGTLSMKILVLPLVLPRIQPRAPDKETADRKGTTVQFLVEKDGTLTEVESS